EALVCAAFANPDDDTPRLVLADYLEENGEADRAALIRVQCEAARLKPADPRSAELAAEEKDLLARLGSSFEHLPDGFAVRTARGFCHLNADVWRVIQAATKGARIAILFRVGWVEVVRFASDPDWHPASYAWFSDEDVALLRRAGHVDLSPLRLTDTRLVQLATELRPGADGSRVARV